MNDISRVLLSLTISVLPILAVSRDIHRKLFLDSGNPEFGTFHFRRTRKL